MSTSATVATLLPLIFYFSGASHFREDVEKAPLNRPGQDLKCGTHPYLLPRLPDAILYG